MPLPEDVAQERLCIFMRIEKGEGFVCLHGITRLYTRELQIKVSAGGGELVLAGDRHRIVLGEC